MKWLSEIKPEIVHKLHEYEKVRPYSINCIIYKKIPKLVFIIVSYNDDIEDAIFQDLIATEKVKIVGGIGNVTYRVVKININYYKYFLKDVNREYDYELVNDDYSNNCRWSEILCKVGEYINVGANRTVGMGVIRYYPKGYLTENDLLN